MRGYLIGTTAAIALLASGAAYAQNAEEHGDRNGGHAQEHAPAGAPAGEHRAATPAEPKRAAEAPAKAEPNREAQTPAVERERGKTVETPAKAEPKREAQTPAGRETEKRAETPARENKAEPKRAAETPAARENQKAETPAKSEPNREAQAPAARDEHAAANVRVDRDKQARISTLVEKQHVENIKDVDFNIRIGRLVPEHHHFYPLPDEIVSLVPEYRGYDYVVADDDIVIIDPSTRRIVYTMQEGRSSSMDQRATDCQ